MKKPESGLEELQSVLDSRTSSVPPLERRSLHDVRNEVPESWNTVEESAPLSSMRSTQKPKRGNVLTTLFVASLIFFILAVLASVAFFFQGGQTISAGNIRLEILGPSTVGGGEELVLQLAITNENPVVMKTADLVIEFPEGTREAKDESEELRRIRESLGDIESGATVHKTIRARLFGEEGEVKQIPIALEYRVEGSNAFFNKEEVYEVTLNASPVSLQVVGPTEATSGQSIPFVVTVMSNVAAPIQDLLLVAEYPFGFSYEQSTPTPVFGKNIWSLGDLPPGAKRTVSLSGVITGEDTDERFFRFSVGTAKEDNEKELAVAYSLKPVSVRVLKPFLSTTLSIDGSAPEAVSLRAGRMVRADVLWENNLPSTILDGTITVSLEGSAFDPASVTAQGGFYRSGDRTIVWNNQTDAKFESIEPGADGRVGFTFSTLGLSSGQTLRNPEVVVTVTASGRRVSDQGGFEPIESKSRYVLKMGTDLLLSSRVVRTTGPFTNTGPLPPRVDQETTYTVTWVVSNSANAVEDAEVRATIPPYVRFLGTISPSGEKVTYSSLGGAIVWDVGSVEPAQSGSGAREVSFQIGFTPSTSQVGTSPLLMNEQSVTGIDRFTKGSVGSTRPALSTRLTQDPAFVTSDSVVGN